MVSAFITAVSLSHYLDLNLVQFLTLNKIDQKHLQKWNKIHSISGYFLLTNCKSRNTSAFAGNLRLAMCSILPHTYCASEANQIRKSLWSLPIWKILLRQRPSNNKNSFQGAFLQKFQLEVEKIAQYINSGALSRAKRSTMGKEIW